MLKLNQINTFLEAACQSPSSLHLSLLELLTTSPDLIQAKHIRFDLNDSEGSYFLLEWWRNGFRFIMIVTEEWDDQRTSNSDVVIDSRNVISLVSILSNIKIYGLIFVNIY